MEFGRSSNPSFGKNTFSGLSFTGTNVMTAQGAVNKTLIMAALVLLGAIFSWNKFYSAGAQSAMTWALAGGIGGFIFALVTIFKKDWATYTAPVYAVLEGLFLGAISAIFEVRFPGIVIQAVGLTFGTLFALLFAYKSGFIKVTQKLRMGIVAATGGIALFYFITFIVSLFGVNMSFMHGGSTLSIGISLVVVVVAALNLVLDFDFIEQGAQAGAPKYMEWYAAFGLILTLVWLYIEFLNLLAKLNSRN